MWGLRLDEQRICSAIHDVFTFTTGVISGIMTS